MTYTYVYPGGSGKSFIMDYLHTDALKASPSPPPAEDMRTPALARPLDHSLQSDSFFRDYRNVAQLSALADKTFSNATSGTAKLSHFDDIDRIFGAWTQRGAVDAAFITRLIELSVCEMAMKWLVPTVDKRNRTSAAKFIIIAAKNPGYFENFFSVYGEVKGVEILYGTISDLSDLKILGTNQLQELEFVTAALQRLRTAHTPAIIRELILRSGEFFKRVFRLYIHEPKERIGAFTAFRVVCGRMIESLIACWNLTEAVVVWTDLKTLVHHMDMLLAELTESLRRDKEDVAIYGERFESVPHRTALIEQIFRPLDTIATRHLAALCEPNSAITRRLFVLINHIIGNPYEFSGVLDIVLRLALRLASSNDVQVTRFWEHFEIEKGVALLVRSRHNKWRLRRLLCLFKILAIGNQKRGYALAACKGFFDELDATIDTECGLVHYHFSDVVDVDPPVDKAPGKPRDNQDIAIFNDIFTLIEVLIMYDEARAVLQRHPIHDTLFCLMATDFKGKSGLALGALSIYFDM